MNVKVKETTAKRTRAGHGNLVTRGTEVTSGFHLLYVTLTRLDSISTDSFSATNCAEPDRDWQIN